MTEIFRPEAGGIRMELSPWQVELLLNLSAILAEPGESLPVDAYEAHSPENEEFRRLMRSEAELADLADLAITEASLLNAHDGVVLTNEEAGAWLRVVGKTRLILGARLGVSSNAWEADDTMEETPELALLHYLSWVQSSLIDAMSDLLPEPSA